MKQNYLELISSNFKEHAEVLSSSLMLQKKLDKTSSIISSSIKKGKKSYGAEMEVVLRIALIYLQN